MRLRRLEAGEVVVWCLLIALLIAGVALAVAAIGTRAQTLDGLDALLSRREFAEAESRLVQFLRAHPDDPQSNLLMAVVALARVDQKPELALRHLKRVTPRDRPTHALVLLNEGKAYSAMGRYDRAETAWKNALRVDPLVPEAGWALLGLYYIQGRRAAAHDLAISLFAVEPDPRDRAQLLLELIRQDVIGLVAEPTIKVLEPIVRDHPDDLYSAIALALFFVRNSREEEGLSLLRGLVNRFGSNADAWDALLLGLEEAGRFDELAEALDDVPPPMAADNRFARYRGSIAQCRRDWPAAADAYRRAWLFDPANSQVTSRLCQALYTLGQSREADEFARKIQQARKAWGQQRALYDEANADKSLGIKPNANLYHRLADIRECIGRADEALAWHRIALQADPTDPISRAAIKRLEQAASRRTSGGP